MAAGRARDASRRLTRTVAGGLVVVLLASACAASGRRSTAPEVGPQLPVTKVESWSGPEAAVALALYTAPYALFFLAHLVAWMSMERSEGAPIVERDEAPTVCPVLLSEPEPELPELARDLHMLAHCHSLHSDFTRAEPLYRRALEIQERSFGPDAPELATMLADYAGLLRRTGRTRQAWELEQRADKISRARP